MKKNLLILITITGLFTGCATTNPDLPEPLLIEIAPHADVQDIPKNGTNYTKIKALFKKEYINNDKNIETLKAIRRIFERAERERK